MPYLKPPSCKGCPFATRSKYYVPDKIVPGSTIAVVAQNPGEYEERGRHLDQWVYQNGKRTPLITQVDPQPLIGPTGHLFVNTFWPQTGLDYDQVSRMNVIKCRPDGKNTLPPLERNEVRLAMKHCVQAHFRLPPATQYILALGQLSLWFAARQRYVAEWRGYALPYVGFSNTLETLHESSRHEYYGPPKVPWYQSIKVFVTFHPASLFKGTYDVEEEEGQGTGGQKKYYHAVHRDMQKFGRLVRGEWPVALPPIQHNVLPASWPSFAGFDTEYDPSDNTLIRWSMTDTKGQTYVVEADHSQEIAVPRKATIVAQNLLADIGHLARVIDLGQLAKIEDTMFAHSVLWTGEPHSLDFILSIYGSLNRHKHLGGTIGSTEVTDSAVLYSGLDSYTTLMDAWKGMMVEFQRDPVSWDIYNRRLPLAYVIGRAQEKGIAVDTTRLGIAIERAEMRLAELRDTARALTGQATFNLGSHQQVSRAVYHPEEEPDYAQEQLELYR